MRIPRETKIFLIFLQRACIRNLGAVCSSPNLVFTLSMKHAGHRSHAKIPSKFNNKQFSTKYSQHGSHITFHDSHFQLVLTNLYCA